MALSCVLLAASSRTGSCARIAVGAQSKAHSKHVRCAGLAGVVRLPLYTPVYVHVIGCPSVVHLSCTPKPSNPRPPKAQRPRAHLEHFSRCLADTGQQSSGHRCWHSPSEHQATPQRRGAHCRSIHKSPCDSINKVTPTGGPKREYSRLLDTAAGRVFLSMGA